MESLKLVMIKFIFSIGWNISDIIRIGPGICTHKIKFKPDFVSSVENQWILNPSMQKVVKKEIIKWLNAGVVYLDMNITWVSPI